jgi:hypothetical protein
MVVDYVSDKIGDATEATAEATLSAIGPALVGAATGASRALREEFNRSGVAIVTGLTMFTLAFASYHLVTSIMRSQTP